VDDVHFFNRPLTADEIVQVMVGVPPGTASYPSPADEQIDVPRDAVLSWTPGEFAPPVNGHKVYLSESFNDVNAGIGGVTQSAASYAVPQRLDFNKTYYWRVDEVNGPPDFTVYEGSVWSFTTEPFAYPIENIIATASSQFNENTGPENTIDGSGLDENDLHSTDETAIWLSSMTGAQPTWIQYEFDGVYKLHQMWVWNHNTTMESILGFGIKDVTIEYSSDCANWATLGTTHEFARAPGTPGYAYNTTVDMGEVPAKYVKLTANSNWGGILPQYGLSEVRFFHIPVVAREPDPASGATDADVDGVLSWRAGREAASHKVFLSVDEQAVIDETVSAVSIPADSSYANYATGPLELGQSYYWKVNEVNEAETPATWQGNVWSFSTQEHLVVEDFEDYNDFEPDRIFDTWIDGWSDPAKGGSQVGSADPPFAEQTIVHSGKQSMPLIYDNTTAGYSEATANIADLAVGSDWTKYGIKTLSVWFAGDSSNSAEQLYVKVNGSKVTYDGDARNLTLEGWQVWNIELASFGVNLQNVTNLSIGIDGNGASGTLFFDDIRLYAYDRQFITPVEPNTAGLIAYYEFEGNANDSSGNGLHGTVMGGPTFALGKIGQAISLDGVDDYVTVTGYKGIVADRTDPNNPIQRPFSVACWINTADAAGRGGLVNWGSSDTTGVGGQYQNFHVHEGRLRAEHGNGRFRGATIVADGEWHHVAMTVSEGVNLWPPGTQLYVDGQKDTQGADTVNAQNIWNITEDADVGIGVRASHIDRFFNGLIDDARIYDRVLTQEEIAWLAGRTQPFDKPF